LGGICRGGPYKKEVLLQILSVVVVKEDKIFKHIQSVSAIQINTYPTMVDLFILISFGISNGIQI
jgi:hypothetical protein